MAKKTGRPTDYNEAVAERIFEELRTGQTAWRVCQQDWAPCRKTYYTWRHQHPDFAAAADEAMCDGAHAMVEEGLEIADGVHENQIDDVARNTLQINHRKWLASKRNKAYADKTHTTVTGANDGPILVDDAARLEHAKWLAFQLAQGQKAAGKKD